MRLTPAAAEISERALEHTPVEDYSRSDTVLENEVPLALRVRVPYSRPVCRNGKCVHSDDYHRFIAGGILGDRWRCEVCAAEGGRCQ